MMDGNNKTVWWFDKNDLSMTKINETKRNLKKKKKKKIKLKKKEKKKRKKKK